MLLKKTMNGEDMRRKPLKRHKACLLFPNLNSRGGQTKVAISMARCLERSGFETTLLCSKKVNSDSMHENFGTILHIDKEVVLRLWPHKFQTYYEFVLSILSKCLSEIVINPYTSDILPFANITYVHYPRTLLIKEKTKNLFWKTYYSAYNVIEHSSSLRGSEKLVLANSYFTADAVKREFHVNPIVLYPPVDIRPFEKAEEKVKKDLVLTVSRFSSEKGLELVPEVAKSVNAKFVILGSLYEGESYRKVLSLIKKNNVSDKVILVPDAPIDLKLKLLQQAKVYFHTTPFEHFGISIVEGMGAGCIPIVFDSGGPKEFVPERWRYRDEEDAVSKINSALSSWSPSVGREMIAKASRFKEENFENAFSRILNLYVRGKLRSEG